MMDTKIRPFLMFQGKAGEAIAFYTGLFPNSQVIELERYWQEVPGAEGLVKRASISLAGQTMLVTDSVVAHDFGFTPAFSLFIDCESEEEQDALFAALAADGAELMALGDYGFSRRFGWLTDRFGVAWQLNLP